MNTVAARTTKKETVTKVYDISTSGRLELTSRSANIEILTWDRNEVKVTGEITYEGKGSEKDIDILFNAFKKMNAESSKEVLKLNLTLIKSAYMNKSLFRKELIIVLHNNDETSSMVANDIKTAYTIWIPSTLAINIDSRYGKIKMASIKGNIDVTLSNNDLEMGDFGESGNFNLRYSSVTIGRGGISKFNVNNGKMINAAELKNVTIESRYSKFNIAKANDVSINSNNDTFDFGQLNDISATARYSTIRIDKNVGKSKFDFNNSKLFGKNFQTMDIFARYSNFTVSDINETRISSSNNNKYVFATVGTVVCLQSRYDTFTFDEIVNDASFPEANNTNVNITRTSASFNRFSGNFRYGTLRLKINPSVEYNLNYDGISGMMEVSPDRFRTRFVSDKSGSRTTIQGVNAGAKCNIEIVANNTNCRID